MSCPLVLVFAMQLIPDPILLGDNRERQGCSDTEQDKKGPFPTEGIDRDDEEEPVQELTVGEEVKCAAIDSVSTQRMDIKIAMPLR